MRRTLLLGLVCLLGSCEAARSPAPFETLILEGSPYERGVQHGRRLSSKIRSIYTQMLAASILPFLNRLQPDIADFLFEYKKPLYLNDQFSYQVLLQSGQRLAESMPAPYVEELRGIADGSGVSFDEVLLMNTFLDSMLGLRSMAVFLDRIRAPRLLSVEILPGLESDGVDNDGDGAPDEAGESRLDPYEPSPYAELVEIPRESRFRFVLSDSEGIDPSTVRVQLGTTVYESDGPALSFTSNGNQLAVVFTPPEPLPDANSVPIILQAGDKSLSAEPPPPHARFMRDERIVFTTKGFGRPPHEVENRGERDGRTQPPSWAVGLRASATAEGRPLLAQHVALLDNNAMHKHAVLFIHRPEAGPPYAILGWAGLIGGFSGINAEGLVFAAHPSDTLDNPIAGQFKDNLLAARLEARGLPILVLAREVLSRFASAPEAAVYLESAPFAYGWNILLQDSSADMVALEMDSGIGGEPEGPGHRRYGPDRSRPENLDPWGRPWASVSTDDLRMAAQYRSNSDDIRLEVLGLEVRPQRYWSSFYYRSLRAYYLLGERLTEAYGIWDVPTLEELLRNPDLIDQRDSMNAVIYEPQSLRVHIAVGQVPVTAGPFFAVSLDRDFNP